VVIPSALKVVFPRSKKSSKPMKAVRQPPTRQFTIEQVNDPANKRRYPWLRKPYELLMLRRWAKVTRINQALAEYSVKRHDSRKHYRCLSRCQSRRGQTVDRFIKGLPMKYGTQIGEGGGMPSGGQQQRLATRSRLPSSAVRTF
jgi:hypothetical protein